MVGGLGDYLAAKPGRAAAVVLALVIALVLATAGLVYQWTLLDDQTSEHEDDPPYPSEDVPLTLVNNTVLYVLNFEQTGMGNYSGARFAFGHEMNSGSIMTVNNFGNQSLLSPHVKATMNQPILSTTNPQLTEVYIEITDMEGDGCFNFGDTVLIVIDPLREDIVYTMGIALSNDARDGWMLLELSFAVHDGVFYAWSSNTLPTEGPWYL